MKRCFVHGERFILRVVLGLALLIVSSVTPAMGQAAQEAIDYLRSHEPPVFRPNHALLPLGQWRGGTPLEFRVELAENWGYALYLGRMNPEVAANVHDPETDEGRIVRMVAANPDKYKLQVISAPAFELLEGELQDLFIDNGGYCTREDGSFALNQYGLKEYSPEAPDWLWTAVGQAEADMLENVEQYCDITLIGNGGEYGHRAYGHGELAYTYDFDNPDGYRLGDPDVQAAKNASGLPWNEYLDDRKARYERLVRAPIDAVAPEATYVTYMHTGAGHAHRGRYHSWQRFGNSYRPGVSDLAGPESYFDHYNTGFMGDQDMLSLHMNTRTQELAAGMEYSYPWLSLGWGDSPDRYGDLALYKGFLKCVYTSGALGGFAAYFVNPPTLDTPEIALPQFTALGEVHAQFSWLDEFLLNSDLLEGDGVHRWSDDLPAYEFDTGNEYLRVLARKHAQHDIWLVTAWTPDGVERSAQVGIDGIPYPVQVQSDADGNTFLITLSETPGDVNGDGVLDSQDVHPFLRARVSPEIYAMMFPGFDLDERGDMDGSGAFDDADVGLLVDALDADVVSYIDGMLRASAENGQYDWIYDLDLDGDVDAHDRDLLIRDALATEYGDSDLDRDVDFADLSALADGWTGFSGGTSWGRGDFDGNDIAGMNDLALVATYWGFSAAAPMTVLPQPQAALFLMVGAFGMPRRVG